MNPSSGSTEKIERGKIYEGKIRGIKDFGIFVEVVPNKQGLVHVSNIPQDLKRNFSKHFNINDVVKVEVLEYDEGTGRISLRLLA